MPNWVFNSLVVSGDKSELDKLVTQLNQPVTKHYPDHSWDKEKGTVWTPATQQFSNPVFSFWNVIAPTDLEAYYAVEQDKKPNTDTANILEQIAKDFATKNDWYNWNVRNWGAKWDVAVADDNEYPDTQLEWTDEGNAMYRFNTAWSPVPEVIERLAQMYPSLEFDYEYEEEQGWGGTMIFANGELDAQSEWDIPMSHADYEGLAHTSCPCEWNDYDPELEESPIEQGLFDDCPSVIEAQKVLTQP